MTVKKMLNVIFALIAATAILWYLVLLFKPTPPRRVNMRSVQSAFSQAFMGMAQVCNLNKGTWVPTWKECENSDPTWCANAGGQFNECASACRHNPDPAAPCTLQCVPVCSFGQPPKPSVVPPTAGTMPVGTVTTETSTAAAK